MRITATPRHATITLSIALALTLSACGGGSSNSASPTPTVSLVTLSGEAVDGYVRGGTVSLYPAGSNTALVSVRTDANGSYTLPTTLTAAQLQNAHLVITGGTDLSTNLPFVQSMTALISDPTQANVPISPLSTLVSAMVASGASVAQANSQLAAVLGLPSTASLTQDPLTLALQQPTLLQKMTAIQQALDMLAIANTSSTVNSATAMNSAATALGATIAQQSSAARPVSIANLVTAAVATQASKFANLAAVQATAPLTAQVANFTEATVAGSVALILESTPNAATLSGSTLATTLQTRVNNNLRAIASVLVAAQAVAAQNAGATPTDLSAAMATPTTLAGIAANPGSGASTAVKALVQFTQNLDSVLTPSATASAAQSYLESLVLALNASTATPTTIMVTAANNNAVTAIPVVGYAFVFAPGSYTYTLTNFAAGDFLTLPANYFARATIINRFNGTLTIQADDGSNNVINIVLTGITQAQYQSIYNLASFNAVFGAGSIASQ